MTKADKASTKKAVRKGTAVKPKAGKEAADVQVAKRAARWKPEEIEHLLDMIAEWLPGGPNQWENVALNYNRQLKDPTKFDVVYRQRDVESMKVKFKNLRNMAKPTGDPTCPPDVKRAKRLWREIEEAWEVIGGSEEEGEDELEEEDEDEFDEEEGDNDDDEEEMEDAGNEEEEVDLITPPPAPPVAVTPGPNSSVRNALAVAAGENSSAKKPYKTSLRTGLTEQQLIDAGKVKGPKPTTVKKRNIIDKQLADVEKEERNTTQLFFMMMQQAQQREDAQEKRREEREAAAEQRRLEAEQRRQEAAAEQRTLLVSSLAAIAAAFAPAFANK